MDNTYSFTIEKEMEGTRIDSVLSLLLADLSRNYVTRLIEKGALTVNGRPCTLKKYKVKEGDLAEITIPEPEVLDIQAENIPLEIVYEDDDLLVVNKPRGMVVHPAPGNYSGTMVNALMYHLGDRLSSINGVIRPGIVHRIDKDTSGLLVVAKNDKAHEDLARQLKEHSVVRRYFALVYDNINIDNGTIDEPIGRDPKNRLRKKVGGDGLREAVTHYEVLERFGKYTLIRCRLETGRTHQIRVHMAYIKHPLVGDLLYGPQRQPEWLDGQMLHAGVLGFVHPSTGEYLEFKAPIPEYFRENMNRLGLVSHVIDNI